MKNPKKTNIKKGNPDHYVDKDKFLIEVREYSTLARANKAKGEAKPKMTEYLGESIIKIATRYSYIGKFANYTYREEMIEDAIENCVNYLSNFTEEKSSNPFAYVTQICFHAFIRRIAKEKKQQQIKFGLLEQMNVPGLYDLFSKASDLPDDSPEKQIVKEIGLSKYDIDKFREQTKDDSHEQTV